MATIRDYIKGANAHELLVAECDGQGAGVGTRDELEALIAEGVLPAETTLREALPSDF